MNGKDDIIGVYTINSTTGELTFTPKKKFETLEHIESVNIGNNKYIAIRNSSVSYDPTTKEVKSLKDNQYIEHGSAFNGRPLRPSKDGTIQIRSISIMVVQDLRC